jgi:methionyl-tRNA formyltransferase
MRDKRNNLGVVLLFGRKNCLYTNKIKKFLEKNSKTFYFIESEKIGEKIKNLKKKYLKIKYDYIFCFRSFYIINKKLLNNTNVAAINFHAGPPEYRGTGAANYAMYENSKFYGSTAHLINEKIDNGKIINVKKFKLNKEIELEPMLKKTYSVMLKQAFYIIKKLLINSNNLKTLISKNSKYKWSNKIKKLKDLDKFYEIKINYNKKKLDNKIRATYTSKFKPYIIFHKRKFILN